MRVKVRIWMCGTAKIRGKVLSRIRTWTRDKAEEDKWVTRGRREEGERGS